MKKEDLMVGDIIAYVDKDHGIHRPCKVVGISEGGWMCRLSNGDIISAPHVDCPMEECLEPIPLTPELLEKNGLEVSDTGSHFKEDEKFYLEISKYDDGFYWTINSNEYDIIPFHFVHELQHALKLCGIEKEVVL